MENLISGCENHIYISFKSLKLALILFGNFPLSRDNHHSFYPSPVNRKLRALINFRYNSIRQL